MIQVETPDGGTAEFPDETPPDVMRNALRAKFGGGPAKSVAESMKGYATQFGVGAMKGLESVAPLAGSFFGPAGQEVVRQGVNLADKAIGYPEPSGTGQEFARTTGEFIGNPASYIGGGSVGMKVLQAISSAVGSEGLRQLVKGQGPVAEGVASIAGAVLGGQIPRAGTAARVLEPKQSANVEQLRSFGVEPTAGDVIDSARLRRAETTLGSVVGSGGGSERANTRVLQQITDAVGREMGSNESVADKSTNASDILSRRRDELASTFENTAKVLPIDHTKKLGNNLTSISSDLMKEGLPNDTIRLIQQQIDNVQNGFVTGRGKGGQMSGETYQALTRKDTPLSRAIDSKDPNVSYYATRIRTALDDAMEETVDRAVKNAYARGKAGGPAQARAIELASAQQDLLNARKQWYASIVYAKALGDEDTISPSRLRSVLRNTDDNKIQYVLQRSNLARLSRSANAVLSKLPNSNTAERSQLVSPTLTGLGMGVVGRGLMSRPVQAAIKANKLGNAPVALRSAAVAAINQLGGKQAPDGNYYIPDPNRPGKYLQVVPKRAN